MNSLSAASPLLLALTLAFSASACGGTAPAPLGPLHVDMPAGGPSPAKPKLALSSRERPPGASSSKESPFPKVARQTLKNGLGVAVVEAHALPIVQLRVIVRAGSGYGATPGAAELTAQLLKDGGTRTMPSAELLRRVETLGADLGVRVDFDSTVLSIAVPKDHLAEALALLGEVVTQPRLDDGELKKLKGRATDQAEDNARSNGKWTATRLMFRELYTSQNPYANYDLVPSEIAKVLPATVKDFHKRFYVPKNATVVIAGDVSPNAAHELAQKVFGGWIGGDAPKVQFPATIALSKRHVIVAHRPKSVQSDVFIAGLGPTRNSPDWPQIRVANQIMGGGVAGRLFLDVREQRSLAYSAYSRVVELAHAEQPVVLYAGTETAKTGLAAQGLIDNLEKIATAGVTAQETETARRYLSDVFAIRMETIGSIADMVVEADALSLPDGYWDSYRTAVRAIDAQQAGAAATKLFHADRSVLVVAGDADQIAPMLARFGDVTVVDPEQEFKTVKTIPENKDAPLGAGTTK